MLDPEVKEVPCKKRSYLGYNRLAVCHGQAKRFPFKGAVLGSYDPPTARIQPEGGKERKGNKIDMTLTAISVPLLSASSGINLGGGKRREEKLERDSTRRHGATVESLPRRNSHDGTVSSWMGLTHLFRKEFTWRWHCLL